MRHFFSKGTIEAAIWCKKCAKETPHKIDDGRPTHCLVCLAKLDAQHREKFNAVASMAVQDSLF